MNEERFWGEYGSRPHPSAEGSPTKGAPDDTLRLQAAGRPRSVGAGRIADPLRVVRPEPGNDVTPAAEREPMAWPTSDVEVGPVAFGGPLGSASSAAVTRSPALSAGPGPDSGQEASGRRFSAVDGLRGAAVLAVLLHDTGVGGPYFSWAGAGVDVLLVLSGFLATLPLLRRATATGRTGVVGFLGRRAKRLLPALLVSVGMTLAAYGALGHGGWAAWLRGWPLGAVPMPDAPLAPLWLVEVTARSVVAWSLLLAGLCLLARRRLAPVVLVVALLGGAVTVAAACGALPDLGVVSGVQAVALPAGAVAACLVHLAERRGRAVSRPGAVLLVVTGFAAAGALAVAAVLRGGEQGDGRSVVGVVLSAGLLAAVLCGDRGPLVRLLSGGLLTEIGRMSYSLFLLHLPVYWLLRRGQAGLGPLALFLVGGVVTWFLALLVHYLLVERLAARPWRREPRQDENLRHRLQESRAL